MATAAATEPVVDANAQPTIKRMIDRFRYANPMSRDERAQIDPTARPDFWWTKLSANNAPPALPSAGAGAMPIDPQSSFRAYTDAVPASGSYRYDATATSRQLTSSKTAAETNLSALTDKVFGSTITPEPSELAPPKPVAPPHEHETTRLPASASIVAEDLEQALAGFRSRFKVEEVPRRRRSSSDEYDYGSDDEEEEGDGRAGSAEDGHRGVGAGLGTSRRLFTAASSGRSSSATSGPSPLRTSFIGGLSGGADRSGRGGALRGAVAGVGQASGADDVLDSAMRASLSRAQALTAALRGEEPAPSRQASRPPTGRNSLNVSFAGGHGMTEGAAADGAASANTTAYGGQGSRRRRLSATLSSLAEGLDVSMLTLSRRLAQLSGDPGLLLETGAAILPTADDIDQAARAREAAGQAPPDPVSEHAAFSLRASLDVAAPMVNTMVIGETSGLGHTSGHGVSMVEGADRTLMPGMGMGSPGRVTAGVTAASLRSSVAGTGALLDATGVGVLSSTAGAVVALPISAPGSPARQTRGSTGDATGLPMAQTATTSAAGQGTDGLRQAMADTQLSPRQRQVLGELRSSWNEEARKAGAGLQGSSGDVAGAGQQGRASDHVENAPVQAGKAATATAKPSTAPSSGSTPPGAPGSARKAPSMLDVFTAAMSGDVEACLAALEGRTLPNQGEAQAEATATGGATGDAAGVGTPRAQRLRLSLEPEGRFSPDFMKQLQQRSASLGPAGATTAGATAAGAAGATATAGGQPTAAAQPEAQTAAGTTVAPQSAAVDAAGSAAPAAQPVDGASTAAPTAGAEAQPEAEVGSNGAATAAVPTAAPQPSADPLASTTANTASQVTSGPAGPGMSSTLNTSLSAPGSSFIPLTAFIPAPARPRAVLGSEGTLVHLGSLNGTSSATTGGLSGTAGPGLGAGEPAPSLEAQAMAHTLSASYSLPSPWGRQNKPPLQPGARGADGMGTAPSSPMAGAGAGLGLGGAPGVDMSALQAQALEATLHFGAAIPPSLGPSTGLSSATLSAGALGAPTPARPLGYTYNYGQGQAQQGPALSTTATPLLPGPLGYTSLPMGHGLTGAGPRPLSPNSNGSVTIPPELAPAFAAFLAEQQGRAGPAAPGAVGVVSPVTNARGLVPPQLAGGFGLGQAPGTGMPAGPLSPSMGTPPAVGMSPWSAGVGMPSSLSFPPPYQGPMPLVPGGARPMGSVGQLPPLPAVPPAHPLAGLLAMHSNNYSGPAPAAPHPIADPWPTSTLPASLSLASGLPTRSPVQTQLQGAAAGRSTSVGRFAPTASGLAMTAAPASPQAGTGLPSPPGLRARPSPVAVQMDAMLSSHDELTRRATEVLGMAPADLVRDQAARIAARAASDRVEAEVADARRKAAAAPTSFDGMPSPTAVTVEAQLTLQRAQDALAASARLRAMLRQGHGSVPDSSASSTRAFSEGERTAPVSGAASVTGASSGASDAALAAYGAVLSMDGAGLGGPGVGGLPHGMDGLHGSGSMGNADRMELERDMGRDYVDLSGYGQGDGMSRSCKPRPADQGPPSVLPWPHLLREVPRPACA